MQYLKFFQQEYSNIKILKSWTKINIVQKDVLEVGLE